MFNINYETKARNRRGWFTSLLISMLLMLGHIPFGRRIPRTSFNYRDGTSHYHISVNYPGRTLELSAIISLRGQGHMISSLNGPHLLIAIATKSITQTNTSEADNNRDHYEIYSIDRKSSIAIKHKRPPQLSTSLGSCSAQNCLYSSSV
jgi:hypothetical protein